MIDPLARLGAWLCLVLLWAGTAVAQGTGTSTSTIPPLIPPTPSFNGPGPRDRPALDSRKKTALPELPQPKARKPAAAPKTGESEPKEAVAKSADPPVPKGDPSVDPKVGRADAEAKLKTIPIADEKDKTKPGPSAHQKLLKEVLTDRLKWLDAYESSAKELEEAKFPKPNPEQEIAERKSDFERAKAMLEGTGVDASKLLPEQFRGNDQTVTDAKLTELREAIEALRTELKDRNEEVEKLRGKPGRSVTSAVTVIRTERDKTAQRLAALPARRKEREKAIAEATTAESRELARERLIAFEWESRAEELRVQAAEAQIKLELRRSDLNAVALQARELQSRIAKLTLDQLQARYRALADNQQNNLRIAAASEASKATNSEDILDRFKAQKKAELLELEAALTSDEKAYAASPRTSLQEQSRLADRAATEFADLKALLKDDKVSALDALQLNNDFRRVTVERSMIQRTELADAAAVMAHYENQLTELELELLSDAREDRFELESLLSQLDTTRHDEARKIVEETEASHRALLVKRRAVLERLAGRAKATHTQVMRRLQILDEQYALVRTTLFWIRDAEPIGLVTLSQAKREVRHLLPGVIRFLAEPLNKRLWTQPSVEFGLAAFAACLMPFIVVYARKAIRQVA